MKISNILFGMNPPLEETNFKVGFTGIRENRDDGIFFMICPLATN